MKKRILFILTVTMTVLGMSLAGCSSSDNKANHESTEASAESEEKTEAAKQPEEGTRVA